MAEDRDGMPGALVGLACCVLLVGTLSGCGRPRPDPSSERIWGQLDRMHEARLEREREAEERLARREADERAGDLARAEAGREEAEAEADRAREARLREASRAVLAMPRPAPSPGVTITRTAELAGGRFAVLARQNPFVRDGEQFPGGVVEAYLVEAGVPIRVSEGRLEWETLGPEELAAAWAGRYYRGDRSFRARVVSRSEFPPALEAICTDLATGLRERLTFAGFSRGGSPEVTLTPVDR